MGRCSLARLAASTPPGRLVAISDLHVEHEANRLLVEQELVPAAPDSWLIVAGDVAARAADVARTLELLRARFAQVIWTPGNHELWTPPRDPVQLRGAARYEHLVGVCRELGVLTPEDPYPVWEGPGGPVVVASVFVLYDYSWRPTGAGSREEALRLAQDAGVVSNDERFLRPDPYASRAEWCAARVATSERRLAALDPGLPTVLVSHFPLERDPTRILRHPEFAQWCGTERTAGWHLRHRAAAVVHGHLHIPRVVTLDGVPFREVSVGYPREWRERPAAARQARDVLGEAGLSARPT